MGDVVDLRKPKNGETTFLLCSCTPEGEPYLVVSIVSDAPIIVGLMCPACETELTVINGIVQPPAIGA